MNIVANQIVKQTEELLRFHHSETLQETTPQRLHECLGEAVMHAISESWIATQQKQSNQRQAFYFSAEYLVGRLVYNNLFNMELLHEVRSVFAEKGVDLSCMEEIEDAALGNGGLGRLA
ncbi:MAG: glycogen phosphorylase, partial [Eubacteriales bacterium]|nr:glycogen phosphorylase [Eubacteriales bacterium]